MVAPPEPDLVHLGNFSCYPLTSLIATESRPRISLYQSNSTQRQDLYSVISEILQCAIPRFERVFPDGIRPLLRMRIVGSVKPGEEGTDCIWGDVVPYQSIPSEEEYSESPIASFEGHDFKAPEAGESYDRELEVMKDRISLKDPTTQVVAKLVNIVLTPEKPRHPRERWHTEGLYQLRYMPSFFWLTRWYSKAH